MRLVELLEELGDSVVSAGVVLGMERSAHGFGRAWSVDS